MNAATQSESTALSLPERASVALGSPAHEVKLRELVLASAAILAVTNKAGREECHAAYMTLKNTRVNITHTVEDVTEDAKAFTKAVKAEATRLVSITLAEEDRLQKLRDDWDAAEQARKDALIQAERERVEAIYARINEVRNLPAGAIGKTGAEISQMIYELAGTISVDDAHAATFEEFADEYKAVRSAALDLLAKAESKQLGIEADARAAEAARIAEAERIAAEKVALAEQRAENDRIAAEQKAEAKRLADAAAAQQKAAEARQKEIDDAAKAEAARLTQAAAEQQAAFDRQKAEMDAQRRALEQRQAEADARDAAAAKKAKDEARREADHGPSLMMNAEFDVARDAAKADEAERVRLQAMAEQAVTDEHQPTSDLEALMESNADDLDPTDEEIAAIGADFGLTPDAWIARLCLFVAAQAA